MTYTIAPKTVPYAASKIEWDADDAEQRATVEGFPHTICVEVPADVDNEGDDAISDYIGDALSNEFGYCHTSFAFERL